MITDASVQEEYLTTAAVALRPDLPGPEGALQFRTAEVEQYPAQRAPAAETPEPSRSARAQVRSALDALAALVATRPPASVLVEDVLTLVAESLDVGLVFVSRIDAAAMHVMRVLDRAGMGLAPGAAIPLGETYCQRLLASAFAQQCRIVLYVRHRTCQYVNSYLR